MVYFYLPFMVSYVGLFDFTSYDSFLMLLKPYFDGAACLAFAYFTTAAQVGMYKILGYVVFCQGLHPEEIFSQNNLTWNT